MGIYEVYRGYVSRALCKAVTRRVFMEMWGGFTGEEVAEWSRTTWFPHMRWEPEVLAVQSVLEGWRLSDEQWADPQILVRLPDPDHTHQGDMHVDTLPPWAEGMRYKSIFGVELTSTPPHGGGLLVARPAGAYKETPAPMRVHLRAGDVVRMDPDVPHAGTPNLSGNIRVALYFRLLTPV